MKSLSTYAYLNSLLRAKISRRLYDRQMHSLAAAADLAELARLLKDTDYAPLSKLLEEGAPAKAAEKAVASIQVGRYRDIIRHVQDPVRAFVFLLMERYDLEKVEGIMRLWREKAWEDGDAVIRERICYKIPVDEMLKASSMEEIILLLDATPYKKPLAASYQSYRQSGRLSTLEIALETDYYRRLWASSEELDGQDRSVAAKFLGLEIDLKNLEIFMRLRLYGDIPPGELPSVLLPGGSKLDEKIFAKAFASKDTRELFASLAAIPRSLMPRLRSAREGIEQLRFLQALLEEMVMSESRRLLSGYPFSIGTVLAYLALCRSEARQLLRIIMGKYLGLSAERISGFAGTATGKS